MKSGYSNQRSATSSPASRASACTIYHSVRVLAPTLLTPHGPAHFLLFFRKFLFCFLFLTPFFCFFLFIFSVSLFFFWLINWIFFVATNIVLDHVGTFWTHNYFSNSWTLISKLLNSILNPWTFFFKICTDFLKTRTLLKICEQLFLKKLNNFQKYMNMFYTIWTTF